MALSKSKSVGISSMLTNIFPLLANVFVYDLGISTRFLLKKPSIFNGLSKLTR
jgi:hypothetical protein